MNKEFNINEVAKNDFKVFCSLFNDVLFTDVPGIVLRENLSFGACSPETSCEMYDINFRSILATVENENGKTKVLRNIEIYDINGVFIKIITL